MLAKTQIAALAVAPILFGAAAFAQIQLPGTAAPRLAVVQTPDDAEQFDCAWGTEAQLELLEKLNRCDRKVLRKMDSLIVPLDWDRDELDYSPLPRTLDWAKKTDTLVLVHAPMQAFGAYENGMLVHWGPISSGGPQNPTPAGAYFLNWRSKGRHSTVNRSWFLRWYFNFENHTGRSFHEYELPGLPASHGCVRLLGRDAQWMFEWGRSWKVDKTGANIEAYGTPVVILGEYDFDNPPPWRDTELVEQGFELSRLGHWAARTAESMAAEKIRAARELLGLTDD